MTSAALLKHPQLAASAAQMLSSAIRSADLQEFLRTVSEPLQSALNAEAWALLAPESGRWSSVFQSDARRRLPDDLAADALDRECPSAREGWIAVPLALRGAEPSPSTLQNSVLLVLDAEHPADVELLAPVLAESTATVLDRRRNRRRIRRLETILEIAGQWNREHEIEPLLNQMATAATRLLQADRATIFLWDRPNRTLVGRPALGVEGGELRVPDDRGVVGKVVQTGEPLRVAATSGPADPIDHDVDRQLEYRTDTLLCVPLQDAAGDRFGAFEVLNKSEGSFTDEDQAALVELAAHAAVALENAQDRQQLLTTNRQIAAEAAQHVRLIGESPPVEALRSILDRVADTDLAVLILGENGTGKEVVAQSIHYRSDRRDRPFVAVNCAAIPDTLAESELFGHEKGAFTDAQEARRGKFELADGGTLLLDEIGDLSLSGQAKLLRVLEEKTLVRVGGSTPIRTDARLLAATNQNLSEMVREKRFREDLYFRLNVVTVELPPLRDRGDDVLLLAEHFLSDFSRKARRRTPEFSPDARRRLREHAWPGNVRELRNLMERLAFLTAEDRVEVSDLEFILSPRGAAPTAVTEDLPLADATAAFQAEHIRRAVARCSGNMSRAAEALGLHRSNLYRKMRQLDIPPPEE